MDNKKHSDFKDNEYEFMQSLSAAILDKSPTKISKVLKIWIFTIFILIIWASFAEIDEITRGDGKVVPYGNNQIIQNLEGGIVESILIKEGQIVKKDEIILKISNKKSESTSKSNEMKFYELSAKRLRLYAESYQLPLIIAETDYPELNLQMKLALELFNSNKIANRAKDNSIVQQIEQKKYEYHESKAKIAALKKSLEFVKEEINMTAPMVEEGIKSKVDFLKLKREENDVIKDIEAVELSLPRLLAGIKEYRNIRIKEKHFFINNMKEELNKVTAELSILETQQVALSDQVNRTIVKSPVEGIVQKLFIHTVGGVIKPGDNLVEIVPTSKKLYLEIKIKPSDIAFIHPGAEAKVKISAYDYAIHGGLIGKVTSISPDTITDKKENTFYVIHIETEKNHLGTKEHPLNIIPGMTVNVDIVTGKKTVMEYILKPILKSKQYVFSER